MAAGYFTGMTNKPFELSLVTCEGSEDMSVTMRGIAERILLSSGILPTTAAAITLQNFDSERANVIIVGEDWSLGFCNYPGTGGWMAHITDNDLNRIRTRISFSSDALAALTEMQERVAA